MREINTPEQAEQEIQSFDAAEKTIQGIETDCAKQIAAIKKNCEKAKRPWIRQRRIKFETLARYFREHHAKQEITMKLPHGELRFHKGRKDLRVKDKQAAIDSIEALGPEYAYLLHVQKELDEQALIKADPKILAKIQGIRMAAGRRFFSIFLSSTMSILRRRKGKIIRTQSRAQRS